MENSYQVFLLLFVQMLVNGNEPTLYHARVMHFKTMKLTDSMTRAAKILKDFWKEYRIKASMECSILIMWPLRILSSILIFLQGNFFSFSVTSFKLKLLIRPPQNDLVPGTTRNGTVLVQGHAVLRRPALDYSLQSTGTDTDCCQGQLGWLLVLLINECLWELLLRLMSDNFSKNNQVQNWL